MKAKSSKAKILGFPRPKWLPKSVVNEEFLCASCFKVVGVKSRYKIVTLLGQAKSGLSVNTLTAAVKLRQPTVTYHLQTLASVGAVSVEKVGRERIYRLNRKAHCFEECRIPFC